MDASQMKPVATLFAELIAHIQKDQRMAKARADALRARRGGCNFTWDANPGIDAWFNNAEHDVTTAAVQARDPRATYLADTYCGILFKEDGTDVVEVTDVAELRRAIEAALPWLEIVELENKEEACTFPKLHLRGRVREDPASDVWRRLTSAVEERCAADAQYVRLTPEQEREKLQAEVKENAWDAYYELCHCPYRGYDWFERYVQMMTETSICWLPAAVVSDSGAAWPYTVDATAEEQEAVDAAARELIGDIVGKALTIKTSFKSPRGADRWRMCMTWRLATTIV